MALPLPIAELDILSVREEGTRLVIGPRAELAGFRQSDFLKELQVVRRWLENQTGIEEVLIDIEDREFLRGRTLAGLVLLRNNIPEGAEFAVCGRSDLLDAILRKMDAGEQVPVFPDTASAFDYTQPRLSAILAAQAQSALDRWRKPLLQTLGMLVALATLVTLFVTLRTPARVRDYHTLLSIWEETQLLRRENPESAALDRHLQKSRIVLTEMTDIYRVKAATSDEDGRLLAAASALFKNLMTSTGSTDSETEFLRAMQVFATGHGLDDIPRRSRVAGTYQRALLE